MKDERDDLNNPADKLREEKDERLYKRAEEHEEMHYILRSVFKLLFYLRSL